MINESSTVLAISHQKKNKATLKLGSEDKAELALAELASITNSIELAIETYSNLIKKFVEQRHKDALRKIYQSFTTHLACKLDDEKLLNIYLIFKKLNSSLEKISSRHLLNLAENFFAFRRMNLVNKMVEIAVRLQPEIVNTYPFYCKEVACLAKIEFIIQAFSKLSNEKLDFIDNEISCIEKKDIQQLQQFSDNAKFIEEFKPPLKDNSLIKQLEKSLAVIDEKFISLKDFLEEKLEEAEKQSLATSSIEFSNSTSPQIHLENSSITNFSLFNPISSESKLPYIEKINQNISNTILHKQILDDTDIPRKNLSDYSTEPSEDEKVISLKPKNANKHTVETKTAKNNGAQKLKNLFTEKLLKTGFFDSLKLQINNSHSKKVEVEVKASIPSKKN